MRVHPMYGLTAVAVMMLAAGSAVAQSDPHSTTSSSVAAPTPASAILAAASAADPAAVPAQSPPAETTTPTGPPTPPASGPPVPAPPPVGIPGSLLPKDLSVGAMFRNADVVVQAVLIGLVVASIVTWTFLLAKGVSVLMAQRSVSRALADAETEISLAALQLRMRGLPDGQVQRCMMDAAAAEMALSIGQDAGGIKERVASRLHRLEIAAGRRMVRGTGLV